MAICCDRCGKPMKTYWDSFAKLRRATVCDFTLIKHSLLGEAREIELCLDCQSELLEWIASANGRLPAVPHEMTAREFVATISDMCINQFPEGCAPCPLWVAGHGCGEKILPPEDTVAIVEAWAKEHPEERSENNEPYRL